MSVISIESYKASQRERWKRDVLQSVSAELNKIHESNFDAVADKIIEYAKDMSGVYSSPNAAQEQRERLRKDFPELYARGTP